MKPSDRDPASNTEVGGWGNDTSADPSPARPRADDPTVQATPAKRTVQGRSVDVEPASSLPSYRMGELLGRGGMGEVVLAEDLEIGRKVAIKRLRGDLASTALEARFYREARIQALLDHPAVVPVHEIGRDADGRPFFTMKRLAGITLSEAIKGGRESSQRMLRAFADVCLAIELAHARGFIHRDLKPGNIMLGEYGEVYVIDWGLARAVGETDAPPSSSSPSLGGETQLGAVMGTPGYMSPEQVQGERVDTPTDVYALGAILFEILTGTKLGGAAGLDATLLDDVSPANAAPGRAIPPELDRLCVEALARRPADRPTARALAERVQRYLDGDRDLERRRAIAAELVIAARGELESGDPDRRGNAIATAARALALDPQSELAAALVAKIMLEPPPVMPPALVRRLDDIDVQQGSAQARRASRAMASYLLFLPIAIWMGVRDWSAVAGFYALIGVAICLSLVRARWARLPMVVALVLNTLMLIVLSRMTSPFLVMPTLAVGAGILLGMFPQLLDHPLRVIGASVTVIVAPLVLEATGVWAATWQLGGGRFVAEPTALELDGTGAFVFLIGISVATAIVFPLFVRSLAISQRASRRQVEVQAWHLQHLVPKASSVG